MIIVINANSNSNSISNNDKLVFAGREHWI